jgi:poly-gamma-glutamate capsule biosynthesis protein CapA/YwtB (metallophosphatase superfamily)
MLRGLGVVIGLAAAVCLAACSPAAGPAGSAATARGAAPGHSQDAAAGSAGKSKKSASPAGHKPTAAVTISAVGDTMLGNTPDLPPDPAGYFDAVKPALDHGAKIVFGNLEGTLTTAPTSKCGRHSHPGKDCFAFRDPPDYADYLKDAGFTILNDANNHSLDFGPAGQAQTVQAIHAAGLAQTGLPGEITVVRAHGIKVAFVAFAPYSYDASLLDLPAARSLIEQAGRRASVVVVYMHAGAEGSDADQVTGQEEYFLGEDRGNAEAFAHMAIDSGASLVIASGPHVLRGMQFYQGHLIAYSLGNFASYGDFSTDGDLGMSVILHVRLSATGRFEHARIYPVRFTGQGQPVPGGGAVAFIARLSAQDFGARAARISAAGAIHAP